MSRPAPANYIIINKAPSIEGDELAITFNGERNALTADTRAPNPSQRWKISNHSDGKNSYVIPESAPSLQVALGDGVVITLPAAGYVWTIKETNSGYSIQEDQGGKTAFWGIADPVNRAQVTIGEDNGGDTQRWTLEKVA